MTTRDALNGVVTLLYDAVGNTTGLIDPVGNRTTFSYDALNRQTEEKDGRKAQHAGARGSTGRNP